MSSAFEGGVEKCFDAASGFVGMNETTGHDEHVGVVVLTGESGYFFHPYESGTNALVLVQSHGDAFAAAADGNAAFYLALFDSLCQSMTEVGVITTFFGVASVVFVFYVVFAQILLDNLLQGKSCVVTC